MIIPLTLPPNFSPNGAEPMLPLIPRTTRLIRVLPLLELQGELEVSGGKHGQLVGRLMIDDANDGKSKSTQRIGRYLLDQARSLICPSHRPYCNTRVHHQQTHIKHQTRMVVLMVTSTCDAAITAKPKKATSLHCRRRQ